MDDPTRRERLERESFTDLAAALRSRVDVTLKRWAAEIRRTIPPLRELTFDEVIDHLPVILPQIADALDSGPERALELVSFSPEQGLRRFHQQYDIRELFYEDRTLRSIILEEASDALGRTMTAPESVALNLAVDLMLQQAVVAYVDRQQAHLRDAADLEVRHLSFLSHDLRNNLQTVSLTLALLREQLGDRGGFAEERESLDDADRAIQETVDGMTRLIQSERDKHDRGAARGARVMVLKLATDVCRRFAAGASRKGLRLEVEIAADLSFDSDVELLTLVLQNLLGNAVKYAPSGTVRVSARRCDGDRRHECELSVSDQGPGIKPEALKLLFETFQRGETHGQDGAGLGLSIASRAAHLLGGSLTVESPAAGATAGAPDGATFTLRLPCGS